MLVLVQPRLQNFSIDLWTLRSLILMTLAICSMAWGEEGVENDTMSKMVRALWLQQVP